MIQIGFKNAAVLDLNKCHPSWTVETIVAGIPRLSMNLCATFSLEELGSTFERLNLI
jgi:hypothetical protein